MYCIDYDNNINSNNDIITIYVMKVMIICFDDDDHNDHGLQWSIL